MSRHVFLVDGPTASSATPISLAEAGLRERRDLQEWVIEHPEVLGDDILIVTSEFDRWEGSDGITASERLDVLGLSSSGRLAVVELKRGEGRSIHIQAITYAALVSGFDIETLAAVHADFMSRRQGRTVSPAEAMDIFQDHVDGDLDPTVLAVPRIILLAASHPPQVITSAVWLTNQGLDIELREVQAWRLGGQIAVTFDQLYPVAGVEDYVLAPARRRAEAAVKVAQERQRASSAVDRIVTSGGLEEAEVLRLRPTTEVPPDVRAAVQAWVEEEPARGRARWTNDPAAPLRWEADGRQYKPTPLIRQILREVWGLDRSVRGTSWWVTEDGHDLVEVAGDETSRGLRDWSDMHEVLGLVGPGEWTTYGEVGSVIGLVSGQPVGNHVKACGDCPNAWRMLTATGKPAENFQWSHPGDTRTCREVLEGEGLAFDNWGKADPQRRVGVQELRRRLAGRTHAED